MFRRFVVALALLAVLTPTTAYAAAPAGTKDSIRECLKAFQHSEGGMTLTQARICAPSATLVTKAKGNGTFIVKTKHGYSILKSQATTTAGGDPCYWRESWMVASAILWVGATMCYDPYVSTWVSGSVYTNCQPYSPSGWCNQQYGYSTAYGYLAQAVGHFRQVSGWFFTFCDVLYIDQWWDGSWDSYSSGC